MAVKVQPESVEADVTEEEGVFFQALGAVCFTAESRLPANAYGNSAEVLAVASRHGVVFLSDPRGAL